MAETSLTGAQSWESFRAEIDHTACVRGLEVMEISRPKSCQQRMKCLKQRSYNLNVRPIHGQVRTSGLGQECDYQPSIHSTDGQPLDGQLGLSGLWGQKGLGGCSECRLNNLERYEIKLIQARKLYTSKFLL